MFTATLCLTAEKQQPPKQTSTGKQVNKMRYACLTEYPSPVKGMKLLSHTVREMILENVTLSEGS